MKHKSLTIHGMDPQLDKLIQARAKTERLSLNKTIKKILEEALGIKPKNETKRQEEFKEFCGVWSAKDLKTFNAEITDMERVNPEDWQ